MLHILRITSLYSFMAFAYAGEPFEVTFTENNKTLIILSAQSDETDINLRRYLTSCPLDSNSYPSIFSVHVPHTWESLQKVPHLKFKYDKSIVLSSDVYMESTGQPAFRYMKVKEVLIPYVKGYDALPVIKNENGTVFFSDCNGGLMLFLLCHEKLRSYVRGDNKERCKSFDREEYRDRMVKPSNKELQSTQNSRD